MSFAFAKQATSGRRPPVAATARFAGVLLVLLGLVGALEWRLGG